MEELHFACAAHNSSGPSLVFSPYYLVYTGEFSSKWAGDHPGSHDEDDDNSEEEGERCLLHLACSHG